MKVAVLPVAASRKWNPYVWLVNQGMRAHDINAHDLTPESLATQQFDLVHIHWFEGYMGFRNPVRVWLRMSELLKGIDRQREGGAKLIYTAHNVVTHDAPWRRLEDWFVRQFLRRVDGTIFLAEDSIPLVRNRFPELRGPSVVIPHCDYGNWYPDTVTPPEARAKFGIPDSYLVIAHVGQIKAYKNVPELIRAFREIPGDIALLIGGRCIEPDLQETIEELARRDRRVFLDLRHLEDEDIQVFMRASDVAVFPYRNILNSGSAMMALTFGKPVVVPNVGSMPELQQRINADWVRLYDGEFSESVLNSAIAWARETDRGERPPMAELSVAAIAAQHAEFYRKIAGTSA